jgi:hypothetical protein
MVQIKKKNWWEHFVVTQAYPLKYPNSKRYHTEFW